MDRDNLVAEGIITEVELKKNDDEENSIRNKQVDEISLNVEYDMNNSNLKIVQDNDEEKPEINSYSDVVELDIEYDMNNEELTNDNDINAMKNEQLTDLSNYIKYDNENNIKIDDEELNIDKSVKEEFEYENNDTLNNIEIDKELEINEEELNVEKVTTKFEEEPKYKDVEVYKSLDDIKLDEKSKLNNNYKEYYEISWK